MSIPYPQITQSPAIQRRCEHCGRIASEAALSCAGCGSGRITGTANTSSLEERRILDAEVCDYCAAGNFNAPPKRHGFDCSRRAGLKRKAAGTLRA